MKTTVTAVIASLMVLLGGVAMAETEAGATATFETFDVDENGMITAEEASRSPALASVFSSADADEDEQLNESEYSEAVRMLGG
ncbi:MAG: hypothetical protein WBG92_13030 [Thiohalocapsa sp.]